MKIGRNVAELHVAEEMLLINLSTKAVQLLEQSADAVMLIEDAGLSIRDFVWSEVSGVFDRLFETTIEWPVIITDDDLLQFYQTISYMKAVLHYSRGVI